MAVAYEPIIKAVAGVMRSHFMQIGDRLKSHDARLAELEQRTKGNLADAWQGPWREGQTYERGALVSFQGGLWLVVQRSDSRPNTAPDCFKLVVKKGSTP